MHGWFFYMGGTLRKESWVPTSSRNLLGVFGILFVQGVGSGYVRGGVRFFIECWKCHTFTLKLLLFLFSICSLLKPSL